MYREGRFVMLEQLGPFDSVLDVGGNIGEFAEGCRGLWPEARITSFEPLPGACREQRRRSGGRWWTEEVAISDRAGRATLQFCVNQHTVSSLQTMGPARRKLGHRDRLEPVEVRTRPLDDYLEHVYGYCLLKIDVEGHEGKVLAGARRVLELVHVVIVEVQQDPELFEGAPSVGEVDAQLRFHELYLAGVLDCFKTADGRVLQLDGVWVR